MTRIGLLTRLEEGILFALPRCPEFFQLLPGTHFLYS